MTEKTKADPNKRLTLEEVDAIGMELRGEVKRRNGETWRKLCYSLCVEIAVLHGEGKSMREMLDSLVGDPPDEGVLSLMCGLSLHLPHKHHKEAVDFLARAKAEGVDLDLVQKIAKNGG